MLLSQTFPAALWTAGRTLADPHLSPDGSVVGYVSSVQDQADLVIRVVEGGAEASLPCVPPMKRVGASAGGAFDWLPNSSGIIYLGADGGLHRMEFESWSCRPLRVSNASLSAITVSPDGEFVAYVADLQDVMVSSTNPDEHSTLRLSSGNDFAVDPAWSVDGSKVAWHEWDDPHMAWDESRIAVRDAAASEPVRIVAGSGGDERPFSVGQPRFSPDGRFLAFLSDATGWLIPWVMDKDFENPRPLVSDEDALLEYGNPTWGAGQRTFCWATGGAEVVAARNHGGWGRLVTVDVESGLVTELLQSTFSSLHSAGDGVVGLTSGPTEPNALTYVGPNGPVTIAQGTPEGVATAGVEPELVFWENDGQTIPGRLYRSVSGDQPGPLLIWIHGGPTDQSSATLHARTAYFVQRGWSVLVPDYRGTTGWGRKHQQAANGQWGVVDVGDVAAGMQAAVANGWAAADSMVPFGTSAGGFTTLLLLARHPGLCAAGITAYPISDLTTFADSTWRYEAHYMDTLVGALPDAANAYEQRSPINHVDSIKSPVLILHGDNDSVVSVEQSIAFTKAARQCGATVEFEIYEGEGHGWRKPATVIAELQRIETFLRRHVLKSEFVEERS